MDDRIPRDDQAPERTMGARNPPGNHPLVLIAVSRGRALERALLRLSPAALMLFVSINTIVGLNFVPNAVTNRITEYSVALIMLPIALASVVLALSGLRWLLMASWPGRLQIIADTEAITFQLGPMGTTRFETRRLDLKYPFEMSLDEDDENAIYESLLDPSEQLANFLPGIRHPDEPQRLDWRILYFTRLDEKQAADALRPFVEYVRS